MREPLSRCDCRPAERPQSLANSRFTNDDYQRFLAGHNLTGSMTAVHHCGDDAAAEGFFGMLKRERVYRRRYRTLAEARTDVFDYIDRFHNPRIRQRVAAEDRTYPVIFSQQPAEMGYMPVGRI